MCVFFRRNVGEWGKVTDPIPSTRRLEIGLKVLAGMYTGSSRVEKRGVDFYLRSQRKWTASMVAAWGNLYEESFEN